MRTEKTTEAQKIAFLKDLYEISKKHQIGVGGCGCCDSPFLVYTNDEHLKKLTSHYFLDENLLAQTELEKLLSDYLKDTTSDLPKMDWELTYNRTSKEQAEFIELVFKYLEEKQEV